MSLSLKKEKMAEFLEAAKSQGESFRCMLWGTVIADLPVIKNRTVVSVIMQFTLAPGVAATMNNAFCYIGLTETSLYVVAVDSYNTSKVIGNFVLPLAQITSLKTRKAFFGNSHTVEIECDGFISLTVKSTSLGTNIKDQKQRKESFMAEMEILKR
ncbi:MAG: hypothetical protein FWD23_15210 [Oscillospiraceae bacterium]|nr:hypothetical protein [Oscillospiraceae bacterium]